MTPEEHKHLAEQQLEGAGEQLTQVKRDLEEAIRTGRRVDVQASMAIVNVTVSIAQTHATLSTVPHTVESTARSAKRVSSWQDGAS